MSFNIEPYSEGPLGLGEGPHWSPDSNRLYYVDIANGIAGMIDDKTRKVSVLVKEDDHVTAVLPVQGDESKIVVAIGTKLYLVNSATGEKTLLNQVDKEGVRFNDAKCDPRGRLWIGTMGLETSPAVVAPEQGSLFVRSKDGKLVEQKAKVTLSNGLAWSHDSKSLYYIDSIVRLIYKFDYDIETGSADNCTTLVDINKDDGFLSAELPDGMTIDIAGNLWVAMFNGGRVVNIDGQTGKVLQFIQFPTSLITSACFGGPNLDKMFVTSSLSSLDEERRKTEPLAGYIFKVTSESDTFKGYKANYDLKL